MFACLFISDFPAEAIVRGEPELRESGVAVLEGKAPLLTVTALNERARDLGCELGMTKAQAESVAGLKLRLRAPAQEGAAHAALLDCAQSFSPRVEDTAPDTVTLDVRGLGRIFGPLPKIARDLARRASEMGLEANVAVAANLDAAVHAARGFSGVTVIAEGKEAERLGTLPVEVLYYGRDDEQALQTLETLDSWGVRTFRALARLPELALSERLGQEGLRLRALALGETSRPLLPAEPPPEFREALEPDHPVELLEPLAFLLSRLLEQICARLAARALATNEIHLRLTLLPDVEVSAKDRQSTIDDRRFERTLRLPVPMQDAKTFLKLLQLELQAHPPQAPVARIDLEALPVRPRAAQGGLFLPAAPTPERMELTLARVAGVVGERHAGVAEVMDSHRPDAFRMRKFHVSGFEFRERAARNLNLETRNSAKNGPALRLFRPPLAARVEARGATPVRIAFAQARGEIVAAAGPWRTSGEWWTEDGWARDEWDVAVETKEGMVLYRIYRNLDSSEWFVFGSYD
jgi:protein ImuB